MPDRVRENLFIGNINDAADVLQNGTNEITHMLSLLNSESLSFFSKRCSNLKFSAEATKKKYVADSDDLVSWDESRSCLTKNTLLYSLEYVGEGSRVVRMAVPIKDMENQNLLDYLCVCLEFIDQSRKVGSVLVHCFAGVSRSAAVITAYLMKTEHLSLEDALESLKKSNEDVCPNDGFLEQLKLFEGMGFNVNHSSPLYKHFRMKVLGDSYNQRDHIDVSIFGADPGKHIDVYSKESPDKRNKSTRAYLCRKCRRVVALKENVLDHTLGASETCFSFQKWRSYDSIIKYNEVDCSSIFVEPLQWMTTVEEGELEGKLSCARCETRLGKFSWSGIRCSCGCWVTPAFQIHKSNVDISLVRYASSQT